jgi:hypothetical protein
MIGEVAAKRTLSFVGLRLVGMDFEPGGWKTVGGPLVDWVALIVAAERCHNKTNNKHHYDVILSLRSGRRALCPSKRTTRERNGHTQNCSLLLNVTKSSSRDASGRLNASRPGQAARI